MKRSCSRVKTWDLFSFNSCEGNKNPASFFFFFWKTEKGDKAFHFRESISKYLRTKLMETFPFMARSVCNAILVKENGTKPLLHNQIRDFRLNSLDGLDTAGCQISVKAT